MSEDDPAGGKSAWTTPAGIGAIVGVVGLLLAAATFYIANRPGGEHNPGPPGETASITIAPSYGPVGTPILVVSQ